MNLTAEQLKQHIEVLEEIEKLGAGQKMLFPCMDAVTGEFLKIVYELQPSVAPKEPGELVWVLNLKQSAK